MVTPDKVFSEAEITRLYRYLLEHSETRRGGITLFIVDMLLGTGLRASELCSLRVDQTPIVHGEDAIWVKGKGQRTRVIYILPELSDTIRKYVREFWPKLLPRRVRRKDYNQPLLWNERKEPFNRFVLYKRLNRLGKRAGILKTMGVHRFRHTYATHIHDQTHNILMLQVQLGHSSVNTTGVYAKVNRSAIIGELKTVHILSVRNTLLSKSKAKAIDAKQLPAG